VGCVHIKRSLLSKLNYKTVIDITEVFINLHYSLNEREARGVFGLLLFKDSKKP
jgi:hypothetical protein